MYIFLAWELVKAAFTLAFASLLAYIVMPITEQQDQPATLLQRKSVILYAIYLKLCEMCNDEIARACLSDNCAETGVCIYH